MLNLNGQGWTIVELAKVARMAGILSIVEILSAYCEEEGMQLLQVLLLCHAIRTIGIEVDLTGDHTPNQSASTNWLGAKSCLHRSTYSTELAPPTDNMDEACRRYKVPHPPPADSVIEDRKLGRQAGDPLCVGAPLCVSDSSSGTSTTCAQEEDTTCSDMLTNRTPPPPYSSLEAPPTPAGLEEVKYEVLMEATRLFDKTPYKDGGHKVGEGGFGEVFQCSLVLQNGTTVNAAVKVLLNQVY